MKSTIAEKSHIDKDSALEALHREADTLKQQADLLLAKRDGVLLSIQVLEAKLKAEQPDAAFTASVRAVTAPSPLSGLAVDFEGTTNHRQRVLRIAQVAGEGTVLNTSEVTRFLVESVCADFTVDNLRPSIHRVFDEQPEVYEKVSPGNWTLIQPREVLRDDSEEE